MDRARILRAYEYLTGPEREEIERLLAGIPAPINLHDLWIQTKDGTQINFGANLNEPQKIALDEIAPGWRYGDVDLAPGARLTFLKGRQEGMTTLLLALFFCAVCNHPDRNAVFIVDLDDNAETAFQKIHFFWEMLPDHRRPKKRFASRKELVFKENRSSLRVLTAGGGRVGQSRTIHYLHCSEVANWPDAPETAPGLFQAVPASGVIALETTAKGDGSYNEETGAYEGGRGAFFAVEYRRAKEGKSGYTPIFLPWWKMGEYRRPAPADFRPTRAEDNEDGAELALRRTYIRYGDEQALINLYGLTHDQLWWRRCKIDEPGMGLILFKQEYPTTEAEAFAASGQLFFPLFDPTPGAGWVFGPRTLEQITQEWGKPDEIVGAYDWGKSSPYSFHLILRWKRPRRRWVIGECYGAGKDENQHATEMIAEMARWGLSPSRVPIFADPSIFGPESEKKRVGEYIEDKLQRHGLRLYRAINDRETTHSTARDYLSEPGDFRISSVCVNLLHEIPSTQVDPKQPNTWLEGGKDHAKDTALRYGPQSEIPVDPNKPAFNPADMIGGFRR